MSITISERAAKRIHEIRQEKNISENIPIRVSVVSGGCSGLTYDLDFDSQKEITKADKEFEDHGVKVVVDMRSFLYLAGTNLDFTDGLQGRAFIFKIPTPFAAALVGSHFLYEKGVSDGLDLTAFPMFSRVSVSVGISSESASIIFKKGVNRTFSVQNPTLSDPVGATGFLLAT